MVPMPPVVVLIVCKVILGAPDANSAFTNWRAAELDMTGGVMHCRREQVELYDPAVDQGADPQPFSTIHCNRAAFTRGPQFDIDRYQKEKHLPAGARGWRFWKSACPVPVMNDNGTPDNPRDDTLVGWAIPPCPEKRGVLECESDTAI